MARVVRLRTKLQADMVGLAEQLRLLPDDELHQLPGVVRLSISRAIHGLYRSARVEGEGLWPGGFIMLSRDQTEYVWEEIRKLPSSARPVLVRDAFMMMMLNIRQDTGEVMMTRDEFAEKLGIAPRHLSTVMSTLERIGVVRRDWMRVDGMRGRGIVTYVVNANVGWNGSLDVRKTEASKVEPPLLKLMQGGKSKTVKSKSGD